MPNEEFKDSRETNIFGTASKASILETNVGYSNNAGITVFHPNDDAKSNATMRYKKSGFGNEDNSIEINT
jgi:hypothetical protein